MDLKFDSIEFHHDPEDERYDVMIPKPGYARAMTRGYWIRGKEGHVTIYRVLSSGITLPEFRGQYSTVSDAMKAILDCHFLGVEP